MRTALAQSARRRSVVCIEMCRLNRVAVWRRIPMQQLNTVSLNNSSTYGVSTRRLRTSIGSSLRAEPITGRVWQSAPARLAGANSLLQAARNVLVHCTSRIKVADVNLVQSLVVSVRDLRIDNPAVL